MTAKANQKTFKIFFKKRRKGEGEGKGKGKRKEEEERKEKKKNKLAAGEGQGRRPWSTLGSQGRAWTSVIQQRTPIFHWEGVKGLALTSTMNVGP